VRPEAVVGDEPAPAVLGVADPHPRAPLGAAGAMVVEERMMRRLHPADVACLQWWAVASIVLFAVCALVVWLAGGGG
jgi:hypothetical protein